MSRTIDDRIVSLTFDNSKFEKNAQASKSTLQGLEQALQLKNGAKGFTDVQKAADGLKLDGISSALENISSKFSALGVIGATVLSNLTSTVMNIGSNLINKVMDPLLVGGANRAQNIEQAKFMFKGLGMDVEDSMASASAAVKGTAYGLDAAAKVASQFGASGMRAGDEMTASLRGVAGVAAMTSSSYEDIGRIFTSVAGANRLYTNDLLQLSGRGINAAADIARYLREVRGETDATEAAVREMTTKGEIDFETFSQAMDWAFGEHATKANETYTGSLANMNAALARIGEAFISPKNSAMIHVFNALSPKIDEIKDALKPMVNLWTEFVNTSATRGVSAINSIDIEPLKAGLPIVANIIRDILALGDQLGKTVTGAFKEIFPPVTVETITNVLNSIKDFTSQLQLSGETTEKFKSIFAGVFAVVSIAFEAIKAVGSALFGVLGALSPVGGGFLSLAAAVGDWLVKLNETIKQSELFKNIADVIVNVVQTIVSWFKTLNEETEGLGDGFSDVFSLDNLKAKFEGLGDKFKALSGIIDTIRDKVNAFFETFKKGADSSTASTSKWSESFSGIVDKLKSKFSELFDGLTFDQLVSGINALLATGVAVSLIGFINNLGTSVKGTKDALGGLGKFFKSFSDANPLTHINETIDQLTSTLKAMQAKLKADTLQKIAIAIAILAAALLILSFIDPVKLAAATTAIEFLIAGLVGAMALMAKINPAEIKNMAVIAGAMILMAIAIGIISLAVKGLGMMEWQELLLGLGGVMALMGAMVGMAHITPSDTKGLMTFASAMILVAIAVGLLGFAVKGLGQMNLGDLVQGVLAVAALMASFAGLSHIIDEKGMLKAAFAITGISVALVILSFAVRTFGEMDLPSLAKGIGSIAVILATFAGFSHIVKTDDLLRMSASLVVVGLSMVVLAKAMQMISEISWEGLGKSAASLIGFLGIITAFSYAIPNESKLLTSAAAVLKFAGAMVVIGQAMTIFNSLDWTGIAKGLASVGGVMLALGLLTAFTDSKDLMITAAAIGVMASAMVVLAVALGLMGGIGIAGVVTGLAGLAGVLVIFGVAANVLGPSIVAIIGLAGALMLIGLAIGIAATGIGIVALGLAQLALSLVALSAIGSDGARVLGEVLGEIFKTLPALAQNAAEAFIVFIETIADNFNRIQESIKTIIFGITDTVRETLPEILDTLSFVLYQFGYFIVENTPYIVGVAVALIIGLLNAMNEHAPRIVDTVVTLITTFSQELRGRFPQLMQEGAALIIGFLNSLASAIKANSSAVTQAAANVGVAIIKGLWDGIVSAPYNIARKIVEVAQGAIDAAMGVLRINSPSRVFRAIGNGIMEGWSMGVDDDADSLHKSVMNAATVALIAVKAAMEDFGEEEFSLSPTITPVVDLAGIESGAKAANSMLSGIDPSASYISARNAFTEDADNFSANSGASNGESNVTFVQNNYSPKALTRSEIYRQTNNQLSRVREVLKRR